MEAIHSFDPEASSPSLDKNLLSLYIGERVVILGKYMLVFYYTLVASYNSTDVRASKTVLFEKLY